MASFFETIRRFRPKRGRGPKRWVFLLYDQLRPAHPLIDGPPSETGVVYVETSAKPARRPYHKQKLALLLSAMRHDALTRGSRGHPVLYRFSERWYDGALAEVKATFALDRVEVLAPAEAEVRVPLSQLPWLQIRPNSLFVTDEAFYRSVFPKPGRRLLETFYRAARKTTGVLMDGADPAGGAWNLDAENRQTWKGEPPVPPRPSFPADAITREVLALVEDRLMVLSNLATLLGVDPQALNRWFWIAYVDAYEWAVTPNVMGMGTWGDGGIFATKPYVSSGKYVQRMGPSLCRGCAFDPKQTEGERACPFNHLYWDFLDRHHERFARNVRMAIPMAALRKLSPAKMADHRRWARAWREKARAAAYRGD